MLAMGEHDGDESVLFKRWLGSSLPWVQPEHSNVCRSLL
jgi:hypothetical protein